MWSVTNSDFIPTALSSEPFLPAYGTSSIKTIVPVMPLAVAYRSEAKQSRAVLSSREFVRPLAHSTVSDCYRPQRAGAHPHPTSRCRTTPAASMLTSRVTRPATRQGSVLYHTTGERGDCPLPHVNPSYRHKHGNTWLAALLPLTCQQATSTLARAQAAHHNRHRQGVPRHQA